MFRFNVPYQVGKGVDHIGFVVVDVKETYKDLVSRSAQPTDVDYYKNPKNQNKSNRVGLSSL
jgi:hypothetical protein